MVLFFNILMKTMNVLHLVPMMNYVQLYQQTKIQIHLKYLLQLIDNIIQQIKNVIRVLNAIIVKVLLLVFVTNVLYVQIMIYVKIVHHWTFIQNII